MDGRLAAGHRCVVQMREALEAVEVTNQHFPAPDAAVCAVSGTVEGKADDRPRQRVFGHAGGYVRVMMLHGNEAQTARSGPLFRPACGEIAGVEIMCDGRGLDLEGAHEMTQRLFEELLAGQVLEIAEVLALIGELSAGQREHVLKVTADSQQRRSIQREGNAERHESTGSADELRRAIDDRCNGIVATLKNLAVVHQEGVSDVAEARAGFVIVDGDGLLAEIRRGHDQRLYTRIGEEQVLERRVRQEDAEPRNSGGDGGRDAVSCAGSGQHDWMRRYLQQCLFLRRKVAKISGRGKVAHHDGERLSVAMLPLAKPRDCLLAGCINAEMKSTDAFDREDLAAQEAINGFGYRIGRIDSCAIDRFKPYMRAAFRAGIGLGMEATVERIVILGLALGTHWKDGHRGLGPVIRDAASDGEARTAVGAVQEGISIAAIRRVEKFAETVGTGGCIGWDAGAYAAEDFARYDTEAGLARGRKVGGNNGVDAGEGRSFGSQAREEVLHAWIRAFELDDNSVRVVADGAGKVFFRREAVNERAETYSLDDPAYPNGLSYPRGLQFRPWRSRQSQDFQPRNQE